MAQLSSDTVLQRAPLLNLELGPSTIINISGKQIIAGNHVLPILEAFTHPVPYSQAVKTLSERVTGVQGWIELVSTITNLYKAGVLVDEAGSAPVAGIGWSAPEVHVAMLNDRVRTKTFLDAIAGTVRPGDVVVDIGTGTGVLAVAAARAGARHVYAIEATDIGRAAAQVFAANDLSDRITVVPGWSQQVELPERANVLIAEVIGNEPLEEGVMETFADARKRFLTPDARIIPSRVSVFAVPVEIDQATVSKFAFTPDATGQWKEWYGIDFTALETSPMNKAIVFKFPAHEARKWKTLGSPFKLADLDLSGASNPLVNESAEFAITTAGMLSGLLMYFELDVAPGHRISTSPAVADETCSWWLKTWLTESPVEVKPGDNLKVSYRYRVDSPGTRIEIASS
jgi:protein arginine N-methyltransferase 1